MSGGYPSVVRVPAPGSPALVRVPAPASPTVVRAAIPGIPGPTGPTGPAGIGTGFGQITYTERSVGPEDTFLPGVRGQLIFTPDPALTMDRLNPPFVGQAFWSNNRVVPRAVDDLYDLQVNLIVTAQVADGRLRLDADVGSLLGPIASDTQILFNTAGAPERVTFRLRVQVLGNFLANGCRLYLTSSVPLTVVSETVLVAPASVRAGP